MTISPSFAQRMLTALIFGPLTFVIWYFGGMPFLFFLLVMLLICAWEWTGMSLRLPPTPVRGIVTVAGIVYVAICFLAIARLGIHYDTSYAVLLLLMLWASDSCAYAFGKTLKGPKLVPRISPNKTWAGLVGAMAGPIAIAALYINFWPLPHPNMHAISHLWIGAVIGLCGQIGDILISAMKRRVGVKDTGRILPGHGGVLDRIDALLFAGLAYLIIIRFTVGP